jgi:hypothetical protein
MIMSGQRQQQTVQNIKQMLIPLSNLTLSEGMKRPFKEQSASQIEDHQLPITCKNSITSANSGTSSSFLKRKKKLLDQQMLSLNVGCEFALHHECVEDDEIAQHLGASSSFTEFPSKQHDQRESTAKHYKATTMRKPLEVEDEKEQPPCSLFTQHTKAVEAGNLYRWQRQLILLNGDSNHISNIKNFTMNFSAEEWIYPANRGH